MPCQLYNYISRNDNMTILNKIKIKYQDAKDIMIAFLLNEPTNIDILTDFLNKNAILYQYLFGNLFPKCFCRINDYGISAKTQFNSYYHNFNLQKNIINWQPKQENDSPINMTTLNDDNNDAAADAAVVVDSQIEQKKCEKKNVKRKIKNDELKKQKREAKKQRLLEQLNENTEKIKKLKKKK